MSTNDSIREVNEELRHVITQHEAQHGDCDVTVMYSGETLDCHREVLIKGSKFFREQLSDKDNGMSVNFVTVNDIADDLLMHILLFCYTCECYLDAENAAQLFDVGCTLQVAELVHRCDKLMRRTASIDNIIAFWSIAVKHKRKALGDFLMQRIQRDFVNIHRTGCAYELPFDQIYLLICNCRDYVEAEDTVLQSILGWIDYRERNGEESSALLELVDFRQLSSEYLCLVMNHPALQNQPESSLIKEAMANMLTRSATRERCTGALATGKASTPNRSIRPRIRQRLVKINNKKEICLISEDQSCWMAAGVLPAWADEDSAMCSTTAGLVIVGCGNKRKAMSAVVVCLVTKTHKSLANLCEPIRNAGCLFAEQSIFVIGGERYVSSGWETSNKVYKYRLSGAKWEELTSMRHPIRHPVVINDLNRLYVIGGNADTNKATYMEMYDMRTYSWMSCQDLPYSCDGCTDGAVLLGRNIWFFTKGFVYMYKTDQDSWRRYLSEAKGDTYTPALCDDQIYTLVRHTLTEQPTQIYRYHQRTNVWSANTQMTAKDVLYPGFLFSH